MIVVIVGVPGDGYGLGRRDRGVVTGQLIGGDGLFRILVRSSSAYLAGWLFYAFLEYRIAAPDAAPPRGAPCDAQRVRHV